MRTVDIHEAKTNLSSLVERAAHGESFIIARAGKALVKVVAIGQATGPKPRIGFMKGWVSVPEDFDDLGREDIAQMFNGSR
jgi:prevent-host-death family protein